MENDPTVALYDFFGWLHAKQKQVLAGAVVVVVVAAIVSIVMWNSSQKEASANQALFAVPSLLDMASPGDPSSTKALLAISQDDSGTSAGTAAQLLAARELFLGGKYAEAQQEFSRFVASHPGHPLLPQANVGLAASLEAQNKIGDAVQQYKKISALYSTDRNIILPVKLTLGRLSEAENKPDQAVNYYKELASLIQNDPNDPWIVEAYERLRLLVAKHPELNPSPPQSRAPSPLLAPTDAEMQLLAPSANPSPAPQTDTNGVLKPALPAPPATNQNPPATPPATKQNPPTIPPVTN